MKLLIDGIPCTDPCPEICRVPKSVVVCPECGGQLLLMVNACDTATRRPLDDEGIEIDCENEPDIDEENSERHRWWQGEWMDPLAKARLWAMRTVRVAEDGE